MALLGIIQKFNALHGSRILRKNEFEVEITLEGKIKNGFVGGFDYNGPKKDLSRILSSLQGKYIDDIVGRATNENIGQYILYRLRKSPISSIKISEEKQYVTIYASEMSFEDYPAQLHFNKGQSLLLRERPRSAIHELNKAITIKEDFAEAYNLRGRCKKYLKKYESSLKDYIKAIEINPRLGEAYRNMGNAYLCLCKFDLMMPAFAKAIEIMPNSAIAFNNRGFAFQKLKKFKLAVADHSKAIKLNPNYAEAYEDRARAYKALAQLGLAKRDYIKTEKLRKSGEDSFANIKMYG